MPASRSPSRGAKPSPPPARSYRFLILVAVAAVLAIMIVALPASLIARFLPPQVRAGDFSGNVWHGSAGTLSVLGRDAGALEWHLHPAALLRLAGVADLHWVKGSFVIDGTAEVARDGITAQNLTGGGPLDDLRDFGAAAGWRGSVAVQLAELKYDFSNLTSAVGKIDVSNVTSVQIADNADLGSYELQFAPGAVSADGSMTAQLTDTGGPVETQAQLHYAAAQHTGTLSGTLMERAEAAPALVKELRGLAQLRPRDSQGRIPVELEFTL